MADRRRFLRLGIGVAAVWAMHSAWNATRGKPVPGVENVRLFLCGDVMLGRGIDQILPHPSRPDLHEPYVRDARRYLELAEEAGGAIPREVPFDYVWGDALAELERRRPDARIVNLETSVTVSDHPWPKTINYRMHPRNAGVLDAAGIDCCVLANNHVLDWERDGLAETLATLRAHGVAIAGAGADLDGARAPAVLPLRNGSRVLVFAAATGDAGVPEAWTATASRAGVHRLRDLSGRTVDAIAGLIDRHRREGDRVVFSIHWGGNWGYAVPAAQRRFAHGLIEEAGVDIVHGHSSHHPKAVELYRDRLILYGCGDFLNDYEGIEGHEEYRGELGLMYFPTIAAGDGRLQELRLEPTRVRRFRVERARDGDREWLRGRLAREYRRFGCDVVERGEDLALQWSGRG